MTTLVTVLRSGGRYDGVWVERLAAGARRHAGFARVVCLTDAAVDIAGVEAVPLLHNWPAWWSKIEAFRPGLFTGTVVLCDLDTVFAGDAAALGAPAAGAPGTITAMEDYFHKGRLSSALMRWIGDDLTFVYERFATDPARWMASGSCGAVPNAVHGDQVVIDHFLREAGISPRYFQHEHPGLLDFYAPEKTAYGPVVIFIGASKPDLAGEPIASLWRGAVAAAA